MKLRVAAIGLVAMLALSGCAEIGSLSDKAQIDVAMQRLSVELDELAGIAVDYTADLQTDYTYAVQVRAAAPDLTTQQLADAAALASNELAGGVFARVPARFSLGLDDGRSVGLSTFDRAPEELMHALELTAAVSAAYGAPAALELSADGTYISFAERMPSPDWHAIRALVATEAPAPSLGFPGAGFSAASFPPSEVTDLIDAIAVDGVFAYVDWSQEGTMVTIEADDFDPAAPSASTVWAGALQVAALVGETPLAARSLTLQGNGMTGSRASVHYEGCAESVPASEADGALAAALVAAGVGGIQPGQCLRA